MQWDIKFKDDVTMTIGAYGNFKRSLEASQDIVRETYFRDPVSGDTRLDSVSEQKNIAGSVIYPSSYGIGFVVQRFLNIQKRNAGWLFGVDLVRANWDNYRFYGMTDSVRNNWELRMGGQIQPVPQKNFFSKNSYRLGFFIGPDYIKLNNNLNQYGFSFGMGIPLMPDRTLRLNQATIINLSFEYIKRGNNNNLLRENLFRLSAGFSLSDLWFFKRKYE
jgi:hypothetical protein